MLIKTADDASAAIATLEKRVNAGGPDAKHAATELRNRKAGLRGERDSAYLIDFDFAGSANWAVIHDLRLEHRGRVAQIDHLLINRWLQVYVLETKQFHAGVKITDDGEFLRWNDFAKRFEGMASPLAQNERHVEVLRDVFDTLDMPTRAGFRISPEFLTFVLVAPSARIDRPKRFDASRVIKADQLKKAIWKDIDAENALVGLLKTAAKIVSPDTVRDVANALVRRHRPSECVIAAHQATPHQLNVTPTPQPAPKPETREAGPAEGPRCKTCGAAHGEVLHGRFGYYFKCGGCGTNTAIRFECAPGHSPRLRKEGTRFFRECQQCGTTELYHTNR